MTCIDCGQEKAATIVQYARTPQGVNHWHICFACAEAFEARKDAAQSEWREGEAVLKEALKRMPHAKVTPADFRKQRRAG